MMVTMGGASIPTRGTFTTAGQPCALWPHSQKCVWGAGSVWNGVFLLGSFFTQQASPVLSSMPGEMGSEWDPGLNPRKLMPQGCSSGLPLPLLQLPGFCRESSICYSCSFIPWEENIFTIGTISAVVST